MPSKGRPVQQCEHCRTARHSRSLHSRCDCGARKEDEERPRQQDDAVGEAAVAGATTTQVVTPGGDGHCRCSKGDICICGQKKKRPDPRAHKGVQKSVASHGKSRLRPTKILAEAMTPTLVGEGDNSGVLSSIHATSTPPTLYDTSLSPSAGNSTLQSKGSTDTAELISYPSHTLTVEHPVTSSGEFVDTAWLTSADRHDIPLSWPAEPTPLTLSRNQDEAFHELGHAHQLQESSVASAYEHDLLGLHQAPIQPDLSGPFYSLADTDHLAASSSEYPATDFATPLGAELLTYTSFDPSSLPADAGPSSSAMDILPDGYIWPGDFEMFSYTTRPNR